MFKTQITICIFRIYFEQIAVTSASPVNGVLVGGDKGRADAKKAAARWKGSLHHCRCQKRARSSDAEIVRNYDII